MAEEKPGPSAAADRLEQLSPDVRAVTVLDAAGALAATTDTDPDRAERAAGLIRELFERADDAAEEPPQQVEAQVTDGAVFALRTPRWVVAVLARRAALSSLMFYDMRMVVLGELERSTA